MILALCNAKRQSGGRNPGDRLQNMIDNECGDADSICDGVDLESVCTFENPVKPDMTDLDVDRIAELKTQFRAKKEECKQQMLKCACCANMSVEDILAARGDQDGSHFGGGGGGGGGGRPDKGGGDDSGGRPGGMGGFGGGFRPQGGGDGSFSLEGMDIQAMVAEKCVDFQKEECANMAGVNCAQFDNIKDSLHSMNSNTRGGKKNLLYCGCCDRNGDGSD